MITPANQRWRDGRDHYRPAGEPIETSRYEVAALELDGPAKEFVTRHHYSASYPAARLRYGLFGPGGVLAGVAVLSVPMRADVLTKWLPCPIEAAAELGRLVLLDSVPANGESWFVTRAFELARRAGLEGVVSFSDPVPRTDRDGRRIFAGHVGTVYQALNARHYGRGKRRTLRQLPDGRIYSDRAQSKVRAGPTGKGFEYAARQLEAFGADRPWPDPVAWLACWLGRLTRPLTHPGNYRYAFGLDRRIRRLMDGARPSDPYPKFSPAA